MKRLPDGIGRTLFIAALTGTIFAGFLLVSPKLAAVGNNVDQVVADESVGVSPVTTTTVVDTTTTTVITTSTSAPTTTVAIAEPSVTEPGYDGSVRLEMSILGPEEDAATATIMDGERVTWRFRVTNATDERLWGVFVWLELAGRATCDSHRIDPGESTECELVTVVHAGDQTAEAWVNAWTSTRQVKDKVFHHFQVLAP